MSKTYTENQYGAIRIPQEDYTRVEFEVSGKLIIIKVRDGELRVEAECPIAIMPLACNNFNIAIKQ